MSRRLYYKALLKKKRYTGMRRLIGCLKLQFVFRSRANNYWALLRKMTCEDKVSYDSMPPCTVTATLQRHAMLSPHDKRFDFVRKEFENTCTRTNNHTTYAH